MPSTCVGTHVDEDAIRELLDETGAPIRRLMPRIYSRELTELIFVYPYCRIGCDMRCNRS